MKVILQRVNQATVLVDNKKVGSINKGILVFVGFTNGDTDKEINYIVDKIINLRIFDDEEGIMNKNIQDVSGSILSVSQFTLYADTKKGRRPSYTEALTFEKAVSMYEKFNKAIEEKSINIETGIFGANMQVSLVNDGPVTIIIEKENKNGKK